MQERLRLAAIILCTAVVLSGCSSPKPETTPTTAIGPTSVTAATTSPTGPPTSSIPPATLPLIDLVDCTTYGLNFYVAEEDVRDKVPSGYEVASSGGLAFLAVFMDSCESAILDNATVLNGAGIVETLVQVTVNETMEGDATIQFYTLELFVDGPKLLERLQVGGLRGIPGAVTISLTETSVTASVAVNGTTWYEVAGTPGVGSPNQLTGLRRIHQLNDDRVGRWLDHSYTYDTTEFPGPTTLRAYDGALSEIRPSDEGALAGVAGTGTSSGRLAVGRA